MRFTEANTVEKIILDAVTSRPTGGYVSGPDLPRQCGAVMVESWRRIDPDAERRELVRWRVPGERDLREAGPSDVRPERLLFRHGGPAVSVWLNPHAHRHVGAVAR